MNKNPKLESLRKQIKSERSIETIHHKIMDLPREEAVELVDLFTNNRVFRNVNVRGQQEDYIAEYLYYLWKISPASFWRHIKSLLNPARDLLWGSDMDYMVIMARNRMPDDVWKKVIEFATQSNIWEQDKDAMASLLQAQCKRFNRREELDKIINSYPKTRKQAAKERIDELMKAPINYRFGD